MKSVPLLQVCSDKFFSLKGEVEELSFSRHSELFKENFVLNRGALQFSVSAFSYSPVLLSIPVMHATITYISPVWFLLLWRSIHVNQ